LKVNYSNEVKMTFTSLVLMRSYTSFDHALVNHALELNMPQKAAVKRNFYNNWWENTRRCVISSYVSNGC